MIQIKVRMYIKGCERKCLIFVQVPHTIQGYALEMTSKTGRAKVREEFMKNAHVQDIRVIDMLVIKGKMELEETHNLWKQKTHVMRYFKETEIPRKTEFLAKFFDGYDQSLHLSGHIKEECLFFFRLG